MSFFQSPESQKKRHTSQRAPFYNQPHTMPTQINTFPMNRAPLVNNTEVPRTWPLQPGVYPNDLGSLGQNNHNDMVQGMSAVPNAFPMPASTNFANAYNPQQMKTSYPYPQSNSWNNTTNATPEQAGWQRSNVGLNDYQQPSPSRSDGSSRTQRSSISSPYADLSPHIKLEDQPDLMPYNNRQVHEQGRHQQPRFLGTGASMIAAPQSHRPFTTSLASYGNQPEDVKCSFDPYDIESLSLSGDPRVTIPDAQSKRGFTTPDTAICHCEICGKLFQRSNNLKTHMQTHLPHRSHPHKCEYIECGREFVRKTDLARHEQSVHLRERNFPCPQCGNCFARKDTLTRHIEDGCSKRPEVKKASARIRRASSRRSSSYALQSPSPGLSPLRYPMRPA